MVMTLNMLFCFGASSVTIFNAGCFVSTEQHILETAVLSGVYLLW